MSMLLDIFLAYRDVHVRKVHFLLKSTGAAVLERLMGTVSHGLGPRD